MKKRIISLMCVAAMTVMMIAGCGNESASNAGTSDAGASNDVSSESSSRLVSVNGDSWVSGYFSNILLHNAIDGNKIVDADGNAVWIDNLEPFEITAADYEDYKTYFVDDKAGLYTVAETQAFAHTSYDEIVEAIYGFDFASRVEAKKNAGEESAAATDSGYTIGYNIFGSGSAALDYLEKRTAQAAEALGDKTVLKNDNFTAENIISDFMEVINSGQVQGVCIWAPAAGLIMPIAEACEANGVYFVLNDKVPADAKDALMSMEYFAGAVGPANDVYGRKLAEYAIAQGWKTCVVTTSAEGDTSDQPRYDAFKETFEAAGGTILTTVNNDSTDVSLENVRNALNGLDEAPEFIYGVGSSYALTAITALNDHADWNTKVITSGLEDDVIKLLVQ